jgi:hypothetical protein
MRSTIRIEASGIRADVTIETRDLATHSRASAIDPRVWRRMECQIRELIAETIAGDPTEGHADGR